MGTDLYRVSAREVENQKISFDLWVPVGFRGTARLRIASVKTLKGGPGFHPTTVEFGGAEAVDARSARVSFEHSVIPGDQHGDWKAIATFYTTYGEEICTDEHTFSVP